MGLAPKCPEKFGRSVRFVIAKTLIGIPARSVARVGSTATVSMVVPTNSRSAWCEIHGRRMKINLRRAESSGLSLRDASARMDWTDDCGGGTVAFFVRAPRCSSSYRTGLGRGDKKSTQFKRRAVAHLRRGRSSQGQHRRSALATRVDLVSRDGEHYHSERSLQAMHLCRAGGVPRHPSSRAGRRPAI
jgi:hypothetical protein